MSSAEIWVYWFLRPLHSHSPSHSPSSIKSLNGCLINSTTKSKNLLTISYGLAPNSLRRGMLSRISIEHSIYRAVYEYLKPSLEEHLLSWRNSIASPPLWETSWVVWSSWIEHIYGKSVLRARRARIYIYSIACVMQRFYVSRSCTMVLENQNIQMR